MDPEKLASILSRLTGSEVGPQTMVTLSSVQQGAFASQARKAGLSIDRNRIKTAFSPAGLGQGVAGVAQPASPQPEGTGRALVPTAPPGARIGCDIQSITEFARAVQAEDFKSCPFLTSHFAAVEISRCENQADAMQSLCGLFAAKEAIRKAGDRREMRQITILHDHEGAPGSTGYAISISHSGDMCLAVALRV